MARYNSHCKNTDTPNGFKYIFFPPQGNEVRIKSRNVSTNWKQPPVLDLRKVIRWSLFSIHLNISCRFNGVFYGEPKGKKILQDSTRFFFDYNQIHTIEIYSFHYIIYAYLLDSTHLFNLKFYKPL